MITARNVTKYYDDIKAVDDITLTIKEGNVFGMIGTNGAGKSTFLRMLAGILCPEEGIIEIDEKTVFENPNIKQELFYISDEQYYIHNYTPQELFRFYEIVYPKFDIARAKKLLSQFDLSEKRKINTFSKGMKKQLSVICGVCANTKYLFCDETFDGLDPVMRQAVKSIFASEIEERRLTPVIASHNLRELEDICDHVGLLHKGGVLLSKDLEEMRVNIFKMQGVFRETEELERVLSTITVLKKEVRGSLYTLTARGNREVVTEQLKSLNPVFLEMLPLTLEEIFVCETEVAGYDIRKIIL